MRKGFESGSNQGNTWNTADDNYYAHMTRLSRTPDVPQNLNVHRVSNKNVQHTNKHPHFVEKVEIINSREEIGKDHETKKCQFVDENINSQADGFIKSKHKAFELSRGETFKMH